MIIACMLYFCLASISVQSMIAQQFSISDKQRVSYGMNIMPVLSMHRSSMFPPKPMSICCPIFTEGRGYGADLSFFTKYVHSYDHSFEVSFGFRDIGAKHEATSYTRVNSIGDSGLVLSTLQSALSLIYFQGLYHFTPIDRLELTLGINVGVNSSKNYTYKEELINENVVFDNGLRIRNQSIGALAGINPRYFGGVAGISYAIPIHNRSIFIKPSINYTYGFRPVQFGTEWYADMLTMGIGIEYKPFGEISRPIIQATSEQTEEQAFTIIHPKDSIYIFSKPNRKITIKNTIHEYPVHELLYPEIVDFCTKYSSEYANCMDDYGSCFYPSIIDTLSQRMSRLSNLKIGISKVDSVLMRKFQKCLEYHSIDTSRVSFISTDELSSLQEYSFEILSREYLAPFIHLKKDTSIEEATLGFNCMSSSVDSIQWGLYDLIKDTLIMKSSGMNNSNILITLPANFKKGVIRSIVQSKGKRTLLESPFSVEDRVIEEKDDIPVETAALFDFDSDMLRQVDYVLLNEFRSKLTEKDSLRIESFTDLRGNYEHNVDLAKRRASVVANIFVGIPCDIILSPLKKRNEGVSEYQKAYNRIVIITRKKP